MQATFDLPIIGEIDIVSDDVYLMQFAIRQFNRYFIGSYPKMCEDHYTRLLIHQFDATLLLPKENKQYSRDIIVSEKGCIIGDWHFLKQDDILQIVTKKERKHRVLKYIIECMNLSYRYEKKHACFYEEILFPIFVLYSCFGYYLIHGSVLQKDDLTIFVGGLDGVGKSSIAYELRKYGYIVVADNYVLFDGDNAVPFGMPIRIEPSMADDNKILYIDRNVAEIIDDYMKTTPIFINYYYLLSITNEFITECKEIELLKMFMYMNNAPEINAINRWMGVMNINTINCVNENKKTVEFVGIPRGEIKYAANYIAEECKAFS